MPATEFGWQCLPAIGLSALLAVELFLRLPFLARVEALGVAAMKALGVVRSQRISDHWKERVLPRYAGRILVATLTLAGLLGIWALAVGGVYLLAGWPMLGGLEPAWLSLSSLAVQGAMVMVAAVYAWMRSRWTRPSGGSSDYSPAAQMLHRLALGSPAMKGLCNDLDAAVIGRRAGRIPIQSPVYVTALARAGTTVLLEALASSGRFCSLTYRVMPFVTAPYLWGAVSRSGRRPAARKERAHGDRMQVGYDSPEAFEEVFWSTYGGARNQPDGLYPDTCNDPNLVARYRGFVARVIYRHRHTQPALRYLAKNNNNLLRLPLLQQAFPDAAILVPFRHPADHVTSLLRQHRRFLERHRDDPFSLEYMDFLGHHEFGAHFRPFRFPGIQPPQDPEALLEPDYWIGYWQAVYGHLLDAHGDQVLWFDYDQMCADPRGMLAGLEIALDLPSGCLAPFANQVAGGSPRDDAIAARLGAIALDLHRALQSRARQSIPSPRGGEGAG